VQTKFNASLSQKTIQSHQSAAEAMGISSWPVEISAPDDIEPEFAGIAQDRADAVMRSPGSMLFNERARMGTSALKHRLPVMTHIAEEVPYGLLMSYGQDFPDFFRRSAAIADKILKGAKPADLPVEQPTKFKLVLNQKTAKLLGITFPQTLLVSADEVIE
jgi:putative tryptophan/tyrosine transport system substrate-binding protein